MNSATNKTRTETPTSLTYEQAIERATYTHWTKGEVVELGVLDSYSKEYAARFRAEHTARINAEVAAAFDNFFGPDPDLA